MRPWPKITEERVSGGLVLYSYLTPQMPVRFSPVSFPQETALEVDFHEGMEFGILLTGSQQRSFEGFTYQVTPGDTWLCASWEPHGWQVLTPGTTAVVMGFLPGFLGDEMLGGVSWLSLFASPPSQRPRVCEAEQRARLLRIGYDILREFREFEEDAPDWEDSVRLSLLMALFLLRRKWTPPPVTGKKRHATRAGLAEIVAALRLVHAYPDRKVGISEAAATCGMSRAQFCLVFKRMMGMSFGEFCVQARLGLVAQQLLSSDATIQVIAEQVGFTTASHLHRSFFKRYGCTPGEFRERGRRIDSK
jgi:AraC-like DNA-binding protein